MTTEQQQLQAELGCWVDDALWGWRSLSRVVEIALGLGMEPLDADDQAVLRTYVTDLSNADVVLPSGRVVADLVGEVAGLTDRAEDWLNEHVAPQGCAFGWCEGGFYLWTEECWESSGYFVAVEAV